ncbi:hypothetical protein ACTFIW_009617 [Dictyostelium discoideum]
MSTSLPELKKLFDKLFGDSGKQNTGKEFLSRLESIHGVSLPNPLSDDSKAFFGVACIKSLGPRIISLISAHPALFSIGVATGIGVSIFLSLDKESRSKIIGVVSNCFKKVGGTFKSCWEKACSSVSSFFAPLSQESPINQNETIGITNHIVNHEMELPALIVPVVNGIDLPKIENDIIQSSGVCPHFIRSLINTTLESFNSKTTVTLSTVIPSLKTAQEETYTIHQIQ